MRNVSGVGGTLFIVATPIGNLGDMTFRAVEVLKAADVIACEDTRVTKKLLSHYGIGTPTLAYHEHNAAQMRPKLFGMLEAGKQVALVSDAGTPLISDPGYKLVREAQEEGYNVVSVPGASSVTSALSIGGLPTDRFLFAGFLPPKSAARQKELRDLAQTEATLVLFESATRLEGLLKDIASVLGEREVALCRELTKRFEEVRRGLVAEVLAGLAERPAKGECVLLIAPGAKAELDAEALLRQALEKMHVGDAARHVANLTGQPKKALYDLAMQLKK